MLKLTAARHFSRLWRAVTVGAVLAGLSPSGAQAQATNVAPAFQHVWAGDVIRIQVYREPDLSGEYVVDDRGVLSVPFVGTLQAAGMTRDSVRSVIEAAFRRVMPELAMQLRFVRKVALVGAVRAPGLYPVDGSMTVADLVAMAGGVSVNAREFDVSWTRAGTVHVPRVGVASFVSSLDMLPGDQLVVPERSWLSRNYPWVISTAITVTVAYFRFGR
jgi:polysaccharide export outer membrane protein